MAAPSLIVARRFSHPLRLRLQVLFAKAFESLANTYRTQAVEFVRRLRGRMRQLIVGDGPVPLRPDVCRDAPRDIGLVRWLQHDLIRAVELGLAPALFGHEPTAIGWAGGAELSVGGGGRR